MLKKITFILLLLFTLSGAANMVSAQNSPTGEIPSVKSGTKKSLREYRRAQRITLDNIAMGNMVRTRNFTFYPNQLDYTPNYYYQNIQLTSYYTVTVTPSQFRVLLPIYGNGRYTNQPSIWRELDFFTGNYSYNFVENPKNGGWTVAIKAMDTWSFNTFTFIFDISASGYCQMSIATPWVGPAYFSGNVVSN